MKVFNTEGKFQFIKNEQVKIDKNLKKYQTIITDNNTSFKDVFDEALNKIYELSNSNRQTKTVDDTLRDIVSQLKPNNLIEFLKKPSAQEFNHKFAKILLGEVKVNNYSINVSDSNWIRPKTTKNVSESNISWIDKIKNFFINKKKRIEKEEEQLDMSIVEWFNTLHVKIGKEQEFIDRISGYFKLYDNALKMNQTSHMDSLAQKIIINVYESVLFTNGYNKYIEFSDLESLNRPGARMIDIDYLENFNRPIPDEVIIKKLECDDLCIFDNYCVMYYDPTGKVFSKPSEAKRDPILFGLINHSNKLYYVADWIDEKCDLTLEKIAEQCNVKTLE